MKYFYIKKYFLYPNSLLLMIIGFTFFAIACYPGFMSPDSLEQYKQAHTLNFADGHPPVMAWLWSKLILILDGPQILLYLHLGLLWLGLYIWRVNAGESRSAKWFLLLGFLPWVANFEGVLWKDMGMAFSLLLALGLLSKSRLTNLNIFVVVSLLFYAFMVRSNAPAALIPIIWYVYERLAPRLSSRLKVAATILSLLSMFTFLNFFNYSLLNSEKSHIASFMMIDDLVHLSVVANKSFLPRVDFNTVKECSQEMIGETMLVGRLFCLNTKPAYQHIAPLPYEDVKKAWISAILSNPFECLKFRFYAYSYLLRSPSESPYIYWFSGISSNDMGLTQKNNVTTTALKEYIHGMVLVTPFLFKPYWWLIINLLFLCATLAMRGDEDSLSLIRVLLLSSLLYMLGYIPLAPMADFRYVYWSTLAISLAAIKFFTSNLYVSLNLPDTSNKELT